MSNNVAHVNFLQKRKEEILAKKEAEKRVLNGPQGGPLVKNAKQLVSEYCQRNKCGPAVYTCTADGEKIVNGYFCTLTFGGHSFCTPSWVRTKKNAEMEAAKLAVTKLEIKDLPKGSATTEKLPVGTPATWKPEGTAPLPPVEKPTVKEPEWITITKVEDIYNYLTDDVLAQEFKAFLHCKAQEDKKDYPVFTVSEVAEGAGYTCVVKYDEKDFNSLGVMTTKKQAEQSAAEVCLRTIGAFPSVPHAKYTIQPYKGGCSKVRKRAASSKIAGINLTNVCLHLDLQAPRYRFKQIMQGDVETFKAVCYFEKKVFDSPMPLEKMDVVRQQCAEEALGWLGFLEPQRLPESREQLKIRKKHDQSPLGANATLWSARPSKRIGWICPHNEVDEKYTGERISAATTPSIVAKNQDTQYVKEILDSVLSKEPSIDGRHMGSSPDLSVGEVDSAHPNVVVVGNAHCSLRMYIENGKLWCNNRACKVELLTGHNIRGLKCTYQASLSATHVYLKAELCDDLFYPNPPLPVITKCGIVMLMYDPNMKFDPKSDPNTQDIHVLLRRPSKNFFGTKAKDLEAFLSKQLNNANPSINVKSIITDIGSWLYKEVKLLSEMTMDSLREVLSPYIRYDGRWNEIFAKELPLGLKELKAACIAELIKRGDDHTDKDVTPWDLPNSRFRHRLIPVGIYSENSMMCAYRTMMELTGIKVRLADIEASPSIDLPIEDNKNPHRGDCCRYYVWKGAWNGAKVRKAEDINEILGEGWVEAKEITNKPRKGKKKGKNDDETNEAEEEPKEEAMEVDPPAKATPVKDMNHPQQCHWFKLEEAKELCPTLNRLSSSLQFQTQLRDLQTEAAQMAKEKAARIAEKQAERLANKVAATPAATTTIATTTIASTK